LRNKKGVLSQYSKNLFIQRNEAKNKMKILSKKLIELKIQCGKTEN